MGKRALRQRDGKGKVVNGRVKADEGSWRWWERGRRIKEAEGEKWMAG